MNTYLDTEPRPTRWARLIHTLGRIARPIRHAGITWAHIVDKLTRNEARFFAGVFFLMAVLSFTYAGYAYWRETTGSRIPAVGGHYIEGIVGIPRFINPIFASVNEADRDIVSLVFAGLTTHDYSGEIVGDLAESFTISQSGRVYEFVLRDGLRWSDGEPVDADDVIFTVNAIQNPEYKSPLQSQWQGVRAEKIDDRTIRFTLQIPFAFFLENTTVGIIPQHIWEHVPPADASARALIREPVGAGPYTVRSYERTPSGTIQTLTLERNLHFYNPAYIEKITLRFYNTQDELMYAYRRGELMGASLFSPDERSDADGRGHITYSIRMPRYFGVFFNEEKNAILKERAVRQALSHAAPRNRIVEEVFHGEGLVQEGPLPLWALSDKIDNERYGFDTDRSRTILGEAGWDDENGDGVLEKTADGETFELSFTLQTADTPELVRVAELLGSEWERIGARVTIEPISVRNIQNTVIRPREYEALLFGEVLTLSLDPFSFWHSSQADDPGLNLSGYESSRADMLLESGRRVLDESIRADLYGEFYELITEDAAAVFLYSPRYLYALSPKVKGFAKTAIGTPEQRFENIHAWYIEERILTH